MQIISDINASIGPIYLAFQQEITIIQGICTLSPDKKYIEVLFHYTSREPWCEILTGEDFGISLITDETNCERCCCLLAFNHLSLVQYDWSSCM